MCRTCKAAKSHLIVFRINCSSTVITFQASRLEIATLTTSLQAILVAAALVIRNRIKERTQAAFAQAERGEIPSQTYQPALYNFQEVVNAPASTHGANPARSQNVNVQTYKSKATYTPRLYNNHESVPLTDLNSYRRQSPDPPYWRMSPSYAVSGAGDGDRDSRDGGPSNATTGRNSHVTETDTRPILNVNEPPPAYHA